MADVLGKMTVEIVGDNKKLDKSMTDSEKKTKKLGSTLQKAFTGIAIAAVATQLKKLALEAEKAFQIQEKAELGLNAALKATGQFTTAAFEEMKTFASELQKVTTIGDETSIGLLQTAVNMGLTADEAKRATKQAIGMSEAYGVGLDTALRASANATLGNFDALTRYLPAIKSATTEAEKAAIVNKQLGDAFEVATSNARSAAGVQMQLENNIGDLQETIGGLVSEGMTPWREAMNDNVLVLNKLITTQILQRKVASGEATVVEKLILANEKLASDRKSLEIQTAQLAAQMATLTGQEEENRRGMEGISKVIERQIQAKREQIIETERQINVNARNVDELKSVIEEERQAQQAVIDLATAQEEAAKSAEDHTRALLDQQEAQKESNQLWAEMHERLEQNRMDMVENAGQATNLSFTWVDALAQMEGAWMSYSSAGLAQASELFGAIGALQQATADRELANIDRNLAARIDALDEDLLGEEEYTKQKEALEKEAAKKKAKLEYEANLATWRMKVLSAIASGAQGVMTTIAQWGLPWGLIPAAGVATITGVQLGVLGANRPVKQKFQDGGIVAGTSFTGDQVPVMANSGEMVLNADQQARLFAMATGSRGTSNTNNNQQVTINSMFSLGNNAKIRQAARTLFPAIEAEARRRGSSIVG